MRDPYSEDELRNAEMTRIRARLAELERPPGQAPVPRELNELLNSEATWRSGQVPVPPGCRMIVTLHGRAGLTTAQDILRYLEAPEATSGTATGKVGPITWRRLPSPLAGYAVDGHIVLADQLDRGDARLVLRMLRGHGEVRSGPRAERRLWGIVLLPVLIGMRGLRELGQLATLSPATGTATATATCTGTMTTAMSAAVTPLATAAAIISTPVTLPAVESVFSPPARAESAAAATEPVRTQEQPLSLLLSAQPKDSGDFEPEAADAGDEPPKAPLPPSADPPTAPAPAPATPPLAVSPTPTPTPTPSTSGTAAAEPSAAPTPSAPVSPAPSPTATLPAAPSSEPSPSASAAAPRPKEELVYSSEPDPTKSEPHSACPEPRPGAGKDDPAGCPAAHPATPCPTPLLTPTCREP